MAISQEQADTANMFHFEAGRTCDSKAGPIRYRRNGKTKRWVREPQSFRIPVKHGLYDCYQITNEDFDRFHTGADCPVEPEGHN